MLADPRFLHGSSLAKDVQIRHEPEPKGTFANLQEKGLRIRNYKETDEAGRTL